VYSNKKAAILHAKDYAGDGCEVDERVWGIVVIGPLANAEIQIWNVEKEFV
jgi:hypothetical protein